MIYPSGGKQNDLLQSLEEALVKKSAGGGRPFYPIFRHYVSTIKSYTCIVSPKLLFTALDVLHQQQI